MKRIYDVSLFDFIPFNFKGDKETEYIIETIDYLLRERFIKQIPEVILLDRVEQLEDWKINELFAEFHVDYYNASEKDRAFVEAVARKNYGLKQARNSGKPASTVAPFFGIHRAG